MNLEILPSLMSLYKYHRSPMNLPPMHSKMQTISHNFLSTTLLPNRKSTQFVVLSITKSSFAKKNVNMDTITTSLEDYQSLFLSQRSETTQLVPLRLVKGMIPSDFPLGTYYLVGPGIFIDDHGSSVNPLDGHGYLRSFEFSEEGLVHYMAKYIETKALKEERDDHTGEWKFTYRGPFSLLKKGRRFWNARVMKNVANTSVVRWGGRLLCFWEGGDPYEVAPDTLSTIGEFDFFRDTPSTRNEFDRYRSSRKFWKLGLDIASMLLKPILHGLFKMPHKRILSHFKIDSQRKRLIILSCNAEDMLLPIANFTFYEFDEEFELAQKREFRIRDHLMIHDWSFTSDHYVVVGNRVKHDITGSLLAASGRTPMMSVLTVNPSQTTTPIYLLPRFSSDKQRLTRDWRKTVDVPSQLWVLHIGNAFEEEEHDGLRVEFVASACSYDWFNFNKMFGYDWKSVELDPSYMNDEKASLLPHLVKISIKLNLEGNQSHSSICDASVKWKRSSDFPMINLDFSGKRNTFVYASTTTSMHRFFPHFPFDSVVKLNLTDGSSTTWYTGKRQFIGEPMFVPTGDGEEDGYILVVEYAVWEKRCYLVILDARRVNGSEEAVVAKLEVPKHLSFPLGFHGFWAKA